MDTIIKVNQLVKRFESMTAVDNISFEVKTGELFAFLGINGAGKSTTINMLCILLEKTQEQVELCGLALGQKDKEIKTKIGVVFQGNCLDSLLTVKQNLLLRAYLHETDKKKIKENLDWVCEVLKIKELLHRPLKELSGGQKEDVR